MGPPTINSARHSSQQKYDRKKLRTGVLLTAQMGQFHKDNQLC